MTPNARVAQTMYEIWQDDPQWRKTSWEDLPEQERQAWLRVAERTINAAYVASVLTGVI